jgi:chromosome segregation ATPase
MLRSNPINNATDEFTSWGEPENVVGEQKPNVAPVEAYSTNRAIETCGPDEFTNELSGLFDQLEQVDCLKKRFAASVARFRDMGGEFEASQRQNQELLVRLETERSQKAILKEKIAHLEDEINRLGEAKSGVISRIERLAARMETLETDVERERLGRQSVQEQLARQTEELDRASSELSVLQHELTTTLARLEHSESQLASREVEFVSLSSALHHAEGQERLFKNLLDESTEQNARLTRQLREIEPSNSNHKIQISQLQAALEEERLAKEKVASERMDGLDLLRSELKSANARLEAALARADAQERMLNDSRINYREKLEELRLSERRAVDVGIQLTNAQRRAEAAEREIGGTAARLARLEAERGHFSTHLATMTRALAEKDAAIVLANDRTTFITARLEECQRSARVERERFEADLAAITQLFDGDRKDQALLTGALETIHHTHQNPRVEAEVAQLINFVSPAKLPQATPLIVNEERAVVAYRGSLAAAAGE